jgi:hypothetical protein
MIQRVASKGRIVHARRTRMLDDYSGGIESMSVPTPMNRRSSWPTASSSSRQMNEIEQPSRAANVPFDHPQGVTGHAIRRVVTDDACRANLTGFDPRPDRAILFVSHECRALSCRACVGVRQNWVYEPSTSGHLRRGRAAPRHER